MLNSIENKKILIVIGGGIAAYKVLDVIRELRKNNCEVKTILTNSGKEFVTPLSISALSKNKVFENLFDPNIVLGWQQWTTGGGDIPEASNFITVFYYGILRILRNFHSGHSGGIFFDKHKGNNHNWE